VVPLFYNHAEDCRGSGLSKWRRRSSSTARFLQRGWCEIMRCGLIFRLGNHYPLSANRYAPAELAAWKANLIARWFNIKIENVDISEPADSGEPKRLLSKQGLIWRLWPQMMYKWNFIRFRRCQERLLTASRLWWTQGTDQHGCSIYTGNIIYNNSGLQACPYACCRNTNIFPALMSRD